MNASILIIVAVALFLIAYLIYGRFLTRRFDIDPKRRTPAHVNKDGIDFVPARAPILLGHHFASIAGAGPILGPIYAAVFGWIPVFLWIVIGSIFFGGVHDFSAIVASIRHGGKSIGEVIEEHIGRSGKRLFLVFTWFMLILVVAVFCTTVASTFVKEPAAATSSILFIILAVAFGLSLYRWRLPLWQVTLAGIILLAVCVRLGLSMPLHLSYNTWLYVLFVYIFIASVTPIWILLQPRDFLNSFLLYFVLLGGVAGIFISNPHISFPAFTSFSTNTGTLFPILFVTVACGAISGFHALVSSGTTSKQLNNEKDAKVVGFGGMLIEGVLAVMAMITAVVLLQGDYGRLVSREGGGPIGIFASGVGGFISTLGIPRNAAVTFAALAISAFALTSLDTATRLGRFIFQEFFERRDISAKPFLARNRYLATAATISAAAFFAFSGTGKILWPLFGASNQLLAALVLLAVTVWFAKMKKKNVFIKIPMFFMFAVTLTALGSIVVRNISTGEWILAGMGIMLLLVAAVLVFEAFASLVRSARE